MSEYHSRKMEITDNFYDDPEYCFIAGAAFAAKMTQRVGEILQANTSNLPPKTVLELREIFALNKEILDEQEAQ